MTPAPTTRSLPGTLSSSSAPVEETISFSSIATPGSGATSEPVAMTIAFVSIVCFAAVRRRHFDLARRDDACRADERIDLVLLEQEGDAVDIGGNRVVLVLHHRHEIELRLAGDDAEGGEIMRGLGELFGGMQQRLRGNAADVEAGAAEGLALFDDGDLQAELRGADGADIAAGAGADDDEIVGHASPHKSSTSRAGSSSASLTRTRKVTASLPSTMR